MVLGCRCGVELVVCVSVVRVCVCFWVVVWFFGAVFEWAFGCQGACGVCSRLLEMADVRSPSPASRERGNAPPCAPTPLSHAVREGLGVRAKSGRTLPTANPSDVPLSALPPSPARQSREQLMNSECTVDIIPSRANYYAAANQTRNQIQPKRRKRPP